ncbi:hypothetical protein CAEBREN_19912 [Caenorhabditis brenneri]|uniref:Uncharacterized protein n=1 Tax=Caenorhabditis brenneri TaxID=135651 RepID=G0MGW0_CAEBE|nr:hypothetical protein CAEBREN_19912 [Caenorhabditis brenneri]
MYPQPYGQTQFNYSTNNPPPVTQNGQYQQYQPLTKQQYQQGQAGSSGPHPQQSINQAIGQSQQYQQNGQNQQYQEYGQNQQYQQYGQNQQYHQGQAGPSGSYPQQSNGQQMYMPQMNGAQDTSNAPSQIVQNSPTQRMYSHPPSPPLMNSQYQPPPQTIHVQQPSMNSYNQSHINPKPHITSGTHSQKHAHVTGTYSSGNCPTCAKPFDAVQNYDVPFGVFDHKARPPQYFNQTSTGQRAPHPLIMQQQMSQSQTFYHPPPSLQNPYVRNNNIQSQVMVQCPHPMVQNQVAMPSPSTSATTSYADSAFEDGPQAENFKSKAVHTKIGRPTYDRNNENAYRSGPQTGNIESKVLHPKFGKVPFDRINENSYQDGPQQENIGQKILPPKDGEPRYDRINENASKNGPQTAHIGSMTVLTIIGMLTYDWVKENEHICYLPDGSTFTVFGDPVANIRKTIEFMAASNEQFQMLVKQNEQRQLDAVRQNEPNQVDAVKQNVQNQVDAYKKSIEEQRIKNAIRKSEVDSEPTEILPKKQQNDMSLKDQGTSLSQSYTGVKSNAPQERAVVPAVQPIAQTVPAVATDALTAQSVVPRSPVAVPIVSVSDQKTAKPSQKTPKLEANANVSPRVTVQQESVSMPVATPEQILAEKRALKEAEQRLLKQKKAEKQLLIKLAKEKKLAEENEKKQKKEAEAEKRRIENAKRKAQEKLEKEEKLKEEKLLKQQQLQEKKERQIEARKRQRANKAERKREAEKKAQEESAELERRIEASRAEKAAMELEKLRIEAERKSQEEAAIPPPKVSKRPSFDFLVENADKYYDLHPDDLAHLLEERAKAKTVADETNTTPPQLNSETKADSERENDEEEDDDEEEGEEVEIGIDGTLRAPRAEAEDDETLDENLYIDEEYPEARSYHSSIVSFDVEDEEEEEWDGWMPNSASEPNDVQNGTK